MPTYPERTKLYDIAGAKYPAVTSILSLTWPQPELQEWRLRTAAQQGTTRQDMGPASRGTAVHKAIATYFQRYWEDSTGFTYRPHLAGCMQAFLAFVERYVEDVVLVEQPVFDPQGNWAGTLDAQIISAGRSVVVDWKTSAKLWPKDAVQASAYWSAPRIAHENGSFPAERADAVWVVRLGNDGTFERRIVDAEAGASAWSNCLGLWRSYLHEEFVWMSEKVFDRPVLRAVP